MQARAILLTAVLLALAAPASAGDADAETAAECGWCCFLGPIDYAQCMGTMVYEDNEPAGPVGQVTRAYWDATMHAVDVVQDHLPAANAAAVKYGCDGTTVPDDVVCFAEDVPAPLLYCYGTVEDAAACIAQGELENWRQFNRNVCDHHFCIMP